MLPTVKVNFILRLRALAVCNISGVPHASIVGEVMCPDTSALVPIKTGWLKAGPVGMGMQYQVEVVIDIRPESIQELLKQVAQEGGWPP